MASPTGNSSKQYPKRTGTTSILGPLYETKLLSLIYFRAIHNKTIEEFYIGTNVDKLGSFDDICFKAKLKGDPLQFSLETKPVVLFLQAKHRENSNSVFTLSENDLTDYFYSYLDIRQKFKPGSSDVLFNGNFDETDCIFVLYTTAKGEKRNKTYKGSLANDLNALIGTGDPGSQPSYDEKDVELLYKIIIRDQMKRLARQMAKCIFGEYGDIQMLMQDELVLQYHVILGQEVFNISEIQPDGQRHASFRYVLSDDSSSENADDFIQIFKNNLFTEICKRKVSPPQIFNVPASFGNKDLSIKGGDKKIERKLIDLESKLVKLIEESKPNNKVTIDESMGKGFLQLSGGMASAVGNLLILDESSNLLKINDKFESLGNLSKKLYLKLKEKIADLSEYTFEVKVNTFPKLSFTGDETLNGVVNDFFSTLLFYTSQKNEKEVEETLISEITNSHGDDVQHVEVTSDAIFLKYHDEIQKWSLKSEKGMGTYLDKEGSLYKSTVKHAARQPVATVMHMMYKIKHENYTFRKEAVNTIKCNDLLPGTVIVTGNSALTYAKLVKHIINTVVLDFEYILNLSATNHKSLCEELMKMNKAKVLIAVLINAQKIDTKHSERLEDIANSMMNKKVIVITDQNSVVIAKKYFSPTGNEINDEIKLSDLSKKTQKRILENTKLIFQGNEISPYRFLCTQRILKKITKYIGGAVLNGLIDGTRRIVGKSFNYPICELYIQRTALFHGELSEIIPDHRIYFYTKCDKFTIIRGDPGAAKPVVIIRLLRAFMRENYQWMLRINLLDYTKQFCDWKVNNTVVDRLESLIFFCKVALSEESCKVVTNDLIVKLEECINTGVDLKDWSGDEWTVFEVAMFLNLYRQKRISFFIEGFKDIAATYVDQVLALLSVINEYNRAQTLWVSSKWYDRQDKEHLPDSNVVKFYKVYPLNRHDEIFGLIKIFRDKKEKLEDMEFKNIFKFKEFISQSNLNKIIITNQLSY